MPDERQILSSTVLDGIQTHHFANETAPAAEIVAAMRVLVDEPDDAAMVALHDALAERRALAVADDLCRELRAAALPTERVRSVARQLTDLGTRRNAVALGIVMLGVVGDSRDREVLLTLGALGDLTLYAAVALANSQPDRDRAVFELARRVDGWGRIHAVERLARTGDPEIKAWLLRDGFRNEVMNEYLAHLAATTGDLRAALAESVVDDALLDGAAEILDALSGIGGPAADMRQYPDALPVLARFAELLGAAEPTLSRISVVQSIRNLLREPPAEVDWPPAETTRLAEVCAALLVRPDWAEYVTARLADPHGPFGFNRALRLSKAVGIDAYAQAVAHLGDDSRNGYVWAWVAQRTPDDDVARIADLARALLPLDEIACGPGAGVIRWGEEGISDSILESVLSMLGRATPGTGEALVRAALRGYPVRLRRAAIGVLTAWYDHELPTEIAGRVAAAAEVEPDDDLRAQLIEFLRASGESVPRCAEDGLAAHPVSAQGEDRRSDRREETIGGVQDSS
ncbi:hypothetical protein ACFWM1_15215 [Nocardia sp. NPDC058379]|uniref:hypothetical protein n=1 Tax=unclassified Nocardia TaxID=2637762 RepID=UPI003648109A